MSYCWISFCTKLDVNFLSNFEQVDFAYFVYSRGFTGEHWLTAILFYLLLGYLYKVLVDRKSEILLKTSWNNCILSLKKKYVFVYRYILLKIDIFILNVNCVETRLTRYMLTFPSSSCFALMKKQR